MTRPSARRLGHFLHAGVLSGLGRRHHAGRLFEQPLFSSGLGGIQPAFFLEEGFPQNFEAPPIIRSDYKNGQTILYRPADANQRSYSHQWNITVDRQLGHDLALSIAYVGSAGRRLPSSIDPINAVDPRHLSMGPALDDEFEPGMTSLHGVPLPYAGWVEQMTGCSPSVAQALRPFPQDCDNLQGLNENHGESRYNSLQVKLEKRFANGFYGSGVLHAVKDGFERLGRHPA